MSLSPPTVSPDEEPRVSSPLSPTASKQTKKACHGNSRLGDRLERAPGGLSLSPDREDSYQPRLLRQGPPSGDPVLNTAGKQGGQSLTRSCRNPLPWDLDKKQCFGCRHQALVAPPHLHVAPTSAAIWKALLRLASRPGPSVLPSLLRKVLGRLGPGIRTHALGGSGPKPPWGPLARGTLPSLASTDPRGHHTSALPGGKGRIQDVAEQKLAGLLVPQDGDGEPQIVRLWGGAAQSGRLRPRGLGAGARTPTCRPKSGTMGEKR